MKISLLTNVLLLTSITISAQIIEPTRYNLDSLGYPTDKKEYKYIRVVENYNNQPNIFIFTEYYKSEKIKMKAISTSKEEPKFEGSKIEYYENGNKKRETQYSKNRINGKQTEYYENGNKKFEKIILSNPKTQTTSTQILQYWNQNNEQKVIDGNGFYEETIGETYEKGEIKNSRRQGVWTGTNKKTKSSFTETYENGELVSGVSTDANNAEYLYKELFKKPEPKAGMTSFYQYIGKNYKMPYGVSSKPSEKPKLVISFNVDIDGTLTDFKIIKDLGLGTGEEAIRILKKSPNWIPGTSRGVPTKVNFRLPIVLQGSTN